LKVSPADVRGARLASAKGVRERLITRFKQGRGPEKGGSRFFGSDGPQERRGATGKTNMREGGKVSVGGGPSNLGGN